MVCVSCFFNDTATTEIYTLSLHDALPIFPHHRRRVRVQLLRAVEGDREDGVDLVDEDLLVVGHLRRIAEPDRKSTRLNSSHANISYAVFCLKKRHNAPAQRSNDVREPAGR